MKDRWFARDRPYALEESDGFFSQNHCHFTGDFQQAHESSALHVQLAIGTVDEQPQWWDATCT